MAQQMLRPMDAQGPADKEGRTQNNCEASMRIGPRRKRDELKTSTRKSPRTKNKQNQSFPTGITSESQSPEEPNLQGLVPLMSPQPPVNIPLNPIFTADPHPYIMEVFDKLILPNLQLPETSSSVAAIRKCLYRKFYAEMATNELRNTEQPILSVDDLVPLVLAICAKAGLIIL